MSLPVKVHASSVAALAPKLLEGYRSPFGDDGIRPGARGNQLGAPGHEYRENVVFAGFVFSNSEVGGGAFNLTPQITVEICSNGLTVSRDAFKAIHLGGKLDEGVVKWSEDTQRKQLELVRAQARDAVKMFLDVDYVEMVIDQITDKASTPVKGDAAAVVQTVCKTLKFTEERTNGILDHFIRGGQMTAGGVMQAATSFAQMIDDADEAHDLEAKALDVLDIAARVAA